MTRFSFAIRKRLSIKTHAFTSTLEDDVVTDLAGTEESDFEEDLIEVSANLEKRTALKITLHMDVEVVEDDKALKTGDVVWLTFSERPYYIQGLLSPNAIESTINRVAEDIAASYLEIGSKIEQTEENPNYKDSRASKHQPQPQSSINGLVDDVNKSINQAMSELIDKFSLKFTKVVKTNNDTETVALKPEGLFKIECMNPVYGERVCWQTNYYRFKHLMSGMYLATDENSEFYLKLKRERDDTTLFSFVNVQAAEAESGSRYVSLDSYYLLKSRSECWLRLPLHKLEHSEKAVSDQFQETRVTFGLNTCTHVDTLRVNVATLVETRQKPFLLASYPVLLEAMLVIGDLNCQLKSYYEARKRGSSNVPKVNYDTFEKFYPRVLQCTGELVEFLLNKSPNNIK